MHAKGSGAYGAFTVTHDITKYTRAGIFSKVGKKRTTPPRPVFDRTSPANAAPPAPSAILGVFAMKYERGKLVAGNISTSARSPQNPDLNHAC